MTIQNVIDRILAYHPQFPKDYKGCDQIKCGDPSRECTGIVTALTPTVHVIQRTATLGANLLLVHEPTNYTSADEAGWREDFENSVYEEKMKLAARHGIVIFRDHDHMHAHQPDGIFTGVLKYLGWEAYATVNTDSGLFAHFMVELPEEKTLEEIIRHAVATIGSNGARYIGNPKMKVKRIAIVGHVSSEMIPAKGEDRAKEYGVQLEKLLEEDVDVIFPGEVIDWTVLSYVRDAVQLGRSKAVVNLGHFNWEELGMRYAKEWVSELVEAAVPVTYVPSEDLYSFYVRQE